MNRIEVNIVTGEQTIIPLTEKEIVETQTKYQEELANSYIKSIKAAARGWIWGKNKLKSKP
jgi:hypothetical protein